MEKAAALAALAALAQETRLDIYRLLVQAGSDGLPAGHIGEQLVLPSATLAFHLKELKHAGLATCTRNGRSLIYAAAYPTMNALLFYLTENCCQGHPEACGLPSGLSQRSCQPEPCECVSAGRNVALNQPVAATDQPVPASNKPASVANTAAFCMNQAASATDRRVAASCNPASAASNNAPATTKPASALATHGAARVSNRTAPAPTTPAPATKRTA